MLLRMHIHSYPLVNLTACARCMVTQAGVLGVCCILVGDIYCALETATNRACIHVGDGELVKGAAGPA